MGHPVHNVTVLGTGVLGAQIAFQTAFSGLTVVAYDINEDALTKARIGFENLAQTYRQQVAAAAGADNHRTQEALSRITTSSDLGQAVHNADLVIEAIPEILELKRKTFATIGELAPAKTIFATNSSTLLPSQIADASGRPDRFLALHFANRVWQFNTAEIMGTPQTDPAVYQDVVNFATAIGMVPIELHKEKAGYVLNSLLVPLLHAAAQLAEGGYADPAAVDTTWRIATGSPLGPFQIYDIIGLNTPYNILLHGDAESQQLAQWLKTNYIDQGKLGLASGEGFYKYN